MRAAPAGAAAVLLLVAMVVPAVAATPSPSPSPSSSPPAEDRSTTLSASPTAGPDRTTVVLRGFSDCAVIDGHLLFTSYDGKADNVVVRSTTTRYDYDREKYPFTIRLTVPVTAAPGPAKVYAEPFCGPPEEYPGSVVRPFRVERSSLVVRLSPRRVDSGDRVRVSARTCDGSRGRLTVRVREGGSVRDLIAAVDSAGSAAISARVRADGEVSLPFAAAECRGSSYTGSASYDVRAGSAAAVPEPTPTASASRAATSPTASASPHASTLPTPSVGSASGAAEGSSSGADWLAAAGAALVAVAGAVWLLVHRRRRASS